MLCYACIVQYKCVCVCIVGMQQNRQIGKNNELRQGNRKENETDIYVGKEEVV